MKEIRCTKCNKKLAEAEFKRLEIKCPRCGAFNSMKAGEPPNQEKSQWPSSLKIR